MNQTVSRPFVSIICAATPHSVAQEYEMAPVILVYSALRIIT